MTAHPLPSIRRSPRVRLALTTTLAGAAMLPMAAAGQTLPGQLPNAGDAAVVAGSATISGGSVVAPPSVAPLGIAVNQNNTVINWQHFDVPTGTTATFSNGAGAGTVAVLNRVVGIAGVKSPSDLSGTVNGPGVEVWLSNSAGIMIGNGAAINTGGLVLTTLDIGASSFGTGANIRLVDAGSGAITTTGNTAAYSINTNGGVLAMIAPAVQLTNPAGAHDAGTGTAAFVTATDVTMSNPGSPLGITINAGTALGSGTGAAQQVSGTVAGGRVYFLLTAQAMTNALLAVDADVSTATASGGIVVLGGGGLAQGAAITGSGAGNSGSAAIALNGGATGRIAAGGAGSTLSVKLSSGTLGGTATALGADGALMIDTRFANADIALGAAAVSGTPVTLNAGSGAVTTASVTSGSDYVLTGSSFAGGTLAPTLTAGAASSVVITGTAPLTLPALTAPGTLAISTVTGVLTLGGNLTATAGSLSVAGAGGISLGADVALAGGTGIALNSPVTGAHALTLQSAGTTSLGAVTGLASLTTDAGGTTLLGGNVSTSGAQAYNDNVTLGASVTLSSSGAGAAGTIGFGGTVDAAAAGAQGLTVTTAGTASFAGAVGTTPLAALSVNGAGGATLLGGNVTTAGGQSYNNATIAGPHAAVQTLASTGGGNVTFAGTLDADSYAAGTGAQLAVRTGGTTAFNGGVGGTHPFASLTTDAPGTTTINAAITAAAATFNDPVTIAGARTITGGVTFDAAVSGPGSLTLAGSAAKVANAGLGAGAGAVPLGALTLNGSGAGSLSVIGDIATTGAQTYNYILNLGDPALATARTTTLSGSTVAFNGGAASVFGRAGETLALEFTGAIALDGAVFSGFNGLRVGPAGGTPGATTSLSGTFSVPGDLRFNNAATLAADTVATSTGGGAVSFAGTVDGTAAGGQNLTVNTQGSSGFSGAVGGSVALGTLTTDAGGTTSLGASVTAATQRYNDGVAVGAGTQVLTASAALAFAGTVDGPGGLSLAGAGGKTFEGAVGAGTPLASLASSGGALTINGGSITTLGAQGYASGIVLGAATTLTGTGAAASFSAASIAGNRDLVLDFAGAKSLNQSNGTFAVAALTTRGAGTTTLYNTVATAGAQTYNDAVLLGSAVTTVSAGANAISFNGTLDATAAGGQALVVATTGTTTFGQLVGNGARLAALTTASGPVAINAASIATSGGQSYGGLVTLGSDTTLTGGTIGFAPAGLNGRSAGSDHSLTLTTTGTRTIRGGFTGIRDLVAGGGGGTIVSGSVQTSGRQSYGDAVTLGASATLTSTGSGAGGNADIAFADTVQAATAGGAALTVTTAGTTRFGGDVGGTAAGASQLSALILAGPGGSTIAAGSIVTTGAQSYGGAVTLASAGQTALTSTTGGTIDFAGTIDAAASGVQGLAVNTAGVTSFGGAIGGGTPLATLATDAGGTTAINGGTVRTTGTQRYGDPVTLGTNTVLGGSIVTFSPGGVNGRTAGSDHDLTLTTTGAKSIDGSFTGLRNLLANGGGATTLAGVVTTSGTQTYADAVTLAAATTLRSTAAGAAGDIRLGGAVDGAQALTVGSAGATTFGGTVGGLTPLASITTDAAGSTVFGGGAITTSGAQVYNDPATLTANTVLTGASVSLAGGVSGGGHDLTLTTSSARTIDGSFTGIGNLLAQGGGGTRLSGTVTTAGTQTYADAVTLTGAATAASTGGGSAGNITFAAPVSGTAGLTVATAGTTAFNGTVSTGSLATDAGGSTSIGAAAITTTGGQSYGDAVTLTVAGSGLATLASTGGGAIAFASTLDALAPGGQGLAVATGGTTRFGGAVGAGVALRTLTTDAGGVTAIDGGSVTTTGAQSYGDAVTLGANTILAGGAIGFSASGVNGSPSGSDHDLTLTSAGARTINGQIAGVRNLLADGGGTISLTGNVATSGTQSYRDPVTLAGATTLMSSGTGPDGGGITFGSTLDGAQALSVTTPGAATFAGAVGGGAALASLLVTGSGPVAIDTGTVDAGVQRYAGPATLGTAGATTTLAGGSVTFDSTLNGARALIVDASGATVFGGLVGGTTPLVSLTTDAAGTTTIRGGGVTTSGSQSYGDAVTAGAASVLTGGSVTFGATLDGAQAITINSGGTTTFAGIVGGVAAPTVLDVAGTGPVAIDTGAITAATQRYAGAVTLGTAGSTTRLTGSSVSFGGTLDGARTLLVDASGTTVFAGRVGGTAPLDALTTDAGGTTAINGGGVATTGAQSYGDAVGIGVRDAVLSSTGSGAIGFAGTLDGPRALTIATRGPTTLGGAVGAATPLASLATDPGGITAINGGSVTTGGGQSYGDPITLGADAVLASNGAGAIALGGAVDGARALRVDTAGLTSIAAPVGGSTPLASFAVSRGTAALNGGAVTTTGGQRYAGAVTLGSDTRLTSTASQALVFGSTVDGAHVLSLTGGSAQLLGVAGGMTPLTGLALRTGSVTAVSGNRVGTLAAAVASGLTYDDAGALTIGTVDGLAGIDTGSAPVAIAAGDLLTLANKVAAGGLTLTGAGIVQAAGTSGNAGNGAILIDGRGGTLTFGGTLATSNATANAVTIRNAASVRLGNVATGPGGTLTLGQSGAMLSGDLTQSAGTTIGAGTLTGAIGGGATLTNSGNMIATLGALSANGLALRDSRSGLSLAGPVSAGTGDLALALDAGTLTLAGDVGAPGHTVTLTSGGAISQTAGSITAATLTGSSVGATSLPGAGNAIGRLAAFSNSGGGGIALTDSVALTVTGGVAASGDLTLGAPGIDFTGQSLGATGAISLAGGSEAVSGNAAQAGTALTVTSGGAITLASARAGGDASFDANGTASLGSVTAGSASGITIRALDAQITGAQTAGRVSFVNRSPASVTLKLGDDTSSGGFQLSQAEVNLVNAGTLVVDGGSGNVEIGALAFNPAAGASAVTVLATGRVDILGAVSGGGAGRSFRFGGTAASVDDAASVIEVKATASVGGSLLLGTADLELRGARIGVGEAAGFLTPIGFDAATGLAPGGVASAYVANPASALYNATYGGSAYASARALVSARSLTVRYSDYALFQNTGGNGINAGVVLGGTPSAAVGNALAIVGIKGTGSNAFALFGSINGINGTATALLGSQVIGYANVNLVNSRVNGCLIGSGAGCLSTVVAQPSVNVFDSSQLNVFRSADDLALPFDPVVGGNNEALFSGIDQLDVPITATECAGHDDPSCRAADGKAAQRNAPDAKPATSGGHGGPK